MMRREAYWFLTKGLIEQIHPVMEISQEDAFAVRIKILGSKPSKELVIRCVRVNKRWPKLAAF